MSDVSGECDNCGSTDVEVQSQRENTTDSPRKPTVICSDCGSTIGRELTTNYKSPVVDEETDE
jgi:uncharacterized Zn finger protein